MSRQYSPQSSAWSQEVCLLPVQRAWHHLLVLYLSGSISWMCDRSQDGTPQFDQSGITTKLEMVNRVGKCIYATLVWKKAMSRQPSTGSSACVLVCGPMTTVCECMWDISMTIRYLLDAMIEVLSFGPGKSFGGETAFKNRGHQMLRDYVFSMRYR